MMVSINKFKIVFTFSLAVLLGITSCDNGFQELNTSPNTSGQLDPKFLLTWIWTQPSGSRFTEWRSNLIISSCWSQQFVSGFTEYDTYNTSNEPYTEAYFARMTEVMPEAQDIIDKNPNTIVGAMSLVFKVHFMLRMADLHGEIPYTQAFKPGEFLKPEYEPLSNVYNAFVNDLETAKEWLKDEQAENPGNHDPLYGGDLAKWEKFINSLMLRIGLRLSEVDLQRSTEIVNQALDAGGGGVMTSNDDIAWISHSGAQSVEVNASGIGGAFVDEKIGGHRFRYSDVFLNFIADNNDPREVALVATYDDDGDQGMLKSDVPGTHKGMRAGTYANNTDILFEFAQPRREIVTRAQPALLMTFAEVQFNLAEIYHRNIASGNAKEAYESGVRAAMKMLTLFPDTEEITDDAIDAYLKEPNIDYDLGEPITLINMQKWVALLFNGYEAWANQRRIDIPVLVPVDPENRAPESDGTLPKRVRYPVSQVATSPVQIQKVIGRQGPDNINTRLWWDIK